MPEIQYGQVDVDCRMYHLTGLALSGSKGRAQALVAVDNRLQRLPQRVCVQRSVHAQRQGNIVGGRCSQLFEEPESLLGKGQG